jgi:hypothetical protein
VSSSLPSTVPVDLRVEPIDDVVDDVERSLQTQFDRNTLVRKRRSLGARTGRGTWVRIERRRFDKIGSQGWNGTECAALLEGIAQPRWYRATAWRQPEGEHDRTAVLPVRLGGLGYGPSGPRCRVAVR